MQAADNIILGPVVARNAEVLGSWDVRHRGRAYQVLQTVQRLAVLSVVLCNRKNP